MRSDLDQLMAARELDALIVAITEQYSAVLDYLTGGVVVTRGLAVKARGSAPVIAAGPMETDEAAATGLKVYSLYDLGYAELRRQHADDTLRIDAGLWARLLAEVGVQAGRVGVYGVGALEYYTELMPLLAEQCPQYTFVGEAKNTIFDAARQTKDADEIARIRAVAERASAVVRATRDFISSHRADEDETVIRADGTPLTIGAVKRFVRMALLERDLEDAHMIFAQGRDAAVPHSRGDDAMPLRLGETIVFDLFPREVGGGYYHDMTRTWCIGYAPDAAREAHEQVMTAFEIAQEVYSLGKPPHFLQLAVQDYFEDRGHPTLRSHPGTRKGYVHGLGHHIGLDVHEHPYLHHDVAGDHALQVGNVITIEPGLYDPDAGWGVRIEDTFYIDEHGQLVSLTDVPKDLILPLRG